MRKNGDYIIPFKGLGLGEHQFEFQTGEEFFKSFENPDVFGGKVDVHLNLVKKSSLMELTFALNGKAIMPCDRCLDEVSLPIDNTVKLFVKFGEHSEEVSDELIVLADNEHEINLAPFIYEFIVLSLPARKVHQDDENGGSTCNPDMLDKLEELTGKKESKEIDSRWSKLNDLTKS